MLDSIWQNFGQTFVAFLLVLTVLVYFHELGHYLVARWNGVKIEVFSVGFGRELFGYTDKSGTRWKFSLIPLGGYVKMFGDANAASAGAAGLDAMTDEEKSVSFHFKSLWRRAAIVAAGPIANFILAIFIFSLIFMVWGQQRTPPVIGEVMAASAAEQAGFKPGDRIDSIDGKKIALFEEIGFAVQLNAGEPMTIVVNRDGNAVELTATPGLSGERKILGIKSGSFSVREQLSFSEAVYQGVKSTYDFTAASLRSIGQMIAGQRDTKELSGPVGIATIVGQAADAGPVGLLYVLAILSVSLGLINLFPIPVLDGGHLVLYAIEAVRGKPLSERISSAIFGVGFALLMALMIFATINDFSKF